MTTDGERDEVVAHLRSMSHDEYGLYNVAADAIESLLSENEALRKVNAGLVETLEKSFDARQRLLRENEALRENQDEQ